MKTEGIALLPTTRSTKAYAINDNKQGPVTPHLLFLRVFEPRGSIVKPDNIFIKVPDVAELILA